MEVQERLYQFGSYMQTGHIPVMLEEVMNFLQPKANGQYIDGTLGGGGHAGTLLERSYPGGRVLGIDSDVEALERVNERYSEAVLNGRLVLVHGNFSELARIVDEAGFVSGVDGVLLDLGFSSYQMDNPGRGFSFSVDGPLDMRLDRSQELTAADLVNNASEHELSDIFWRYGDETRSRQIAWRIVRERERNPITRTSQLARLASAGVPYKSGMIHPATRVFQALRIAVNSELERLEAALPQIVEVLRRGKTGGIGGDGGRMVIISFHSLEDRLVKGFMRREAMDCICPPDIPVCVCNHKASLRILTPKPLTPAKQEVLNNPRARSAKLRAAEIVVSS